MLHCLCTRFAHLYILLALVVVKELYMGVWGLFILKKLKKPVSARWYGKAYTASLFVTMTLHMLFPDIALWFSVVLMCLNVLLGVLAMILYGGWYRNLLRGGYEEKQAAS